MRVLLLGPQPADGSGSLPPYLDVLAETLRKRGITVERHGSAGVPYDTERQQFWPIDRLIAEAQALLDGIDLSNYDLLSVHFGNLEIEQLLPALWDQYTRPPAVYHVHTADVPTLFRDHRPHAGWKSKIERALSTFDGYVFFGKHARRCWHGHLPSTTPTGIAWLPTTIPPGTPATAHLSLQDVLQSPDHRPLISLYGYAAPWKDAALLRAAAARMRSPARIVLAGDFWDQPTQAGIDLTDTLTPTPIGSAAEIVTVPGHLDPSARAALMQASTAGVFPYRAHRSFQGSGAIADYLAHGTPVVATNVANMAELIGDAGYLVPPGDPDTLAAALDAVASRSTPSLRRHTYHRARWFTTDEHSTQCLHTYNAVLRNRSLLPGPEALKHSYLNVPGYTVGTRLPWLGS